MVCVYWIRRPEHTDVFTQGYVGVTSKTAEERFKYHIDTSRRTNSKKSVIHKAIVSIGPENLVVETLVIAEEDYCYEIEYKLRPEKSIGWNVAIGGAKPPGVKGLPVSKETREKLSKSLKGKKKTPEQIEKHRQSLLGYKHSEETRKKVSLAGMGRKVSQKSLDKLIERNKARKGEKRSDSYRETRKLEIKAKGWWNHPKANKSVWEKADWFFQKFLEDYTNYTLARKYPELVPNDHCLGSLWKHFKEGWNPNEDELWLKDFNKECINGT